MSFSPGSIARARAVLRWARSHRREMVGWIRRAVEIESPSRDKPALDRMCSFLAEEFRAAGGRIRIHSAPAGDHLVARFSAGAGKRSAALLVIGHHDTVWERDTLASMPCRVSNGKVWGPGALDMKAGLAQALFALRALAECGIGLPRPVTVLSVSDEEVGSASSRALTQKLARGAVAALVLEPGQGAHGALKTSRKGVGECVVRVQGKAAHAGVDFESGASAVLELARQLQRIAGFTDLRRGITVNPGVIRGGTRSNVVAAEAESRVDLRVRRAGDARLLARKFRNLKAFDRRCSIRVEGGVNRPPMRRSAAIATLFTRAQRLAAAIEPGWRLREAATGGGSDGNFTAALGVPTLDGLGAVGEGAHAPRESVVISELPRRTALLAALMAEL